MKKYLFVKTGTVTQYLFCHALKGTTKQIVKPSFTCVKNSSLTLHNFVFCRAESWHIFLRKNREMGKYIKPFKQVGSFYPITNLLTVVQVWCFTQYQTCTIKKSSKSVWAKSATLTAYILLRKVRTPDTWNTLLNYYFLLLPYYSPFLLLITIRSPKKDF